MHAGPPLVSPDQGADIRAEYASVFSCRPLAEDVPRTAGASIFLEFTILHCDIRGFISHKAEFEAQLRLAHALPFVICFNETLLDECTLDTNYN